MDITITIQVKGEAFDPPNLEAEVARILTTVASGIRVTGVVPGQPLRDSNGNTVGRLEVTL